MISKEAIKEYLDFDLDSWNWVKDLTREQLEKELNFCLFKTEPRKHQLESVLIGLANDSFLFFSDQGTGKTKIVLDILSNRNDWKRALVVSPNDASVSTWTDEIKKHSDLSSLELLGRIEDRWESIYQKSDLVLINYTGLLLMCTNSVNSKWIIDTKKVKELSSLFDVLVFDEAHLAKNNNSLTAKVLKKISRHMKQVWGMTGTPINRDPIAFFPLFSIVDNGETLGDTISMFREAYFVAKDSYWGGVDYKFKKELERNLNERICNKSIRYLKEDVLDLPERTFTTVPIELSDEQQKYYLGEYSTFSSSSDMDVIKLSFSKLRMICSGFLNFVNDDGEAKTIEIKKNPKLDTLVDLIKSTPEDSKVVVFLEHVKAGEIVSNRLKKEKISHERLYGGTKDKIAVKNKFINTTDCKVLVANIKSGGTSLNLQSANYVIYYEMPTSTIDYKQSMDRLFRIGQKKNVFVYELISKNTVEERIKKFLNEGKSLQRALVDGFFKEKK